MRTANPSLSSKTFTNLGPAPLATGNVMTIQGTVNKTALLLLLVLLPASWVWSLFYSDPAGNIGMITTLMFVGAIGGLIVAIVTIFKKTVAHITAPLYALLQGLVIGGLSAIFEASFPGIVIQAVALTFGTLTCLLLAYTTRLIRPTEKFKTGVVIATGAIALIYVVSFILQLFGASVPYIHGNGIVGIGFSLLVVGIAALNLVLDFSFIEEGARYGAPKYMEWYGAFGLMVTLIWLYIEILRLLSKLRSR